MRSHAIRKGGRKQQKSCAQRHVCASSRPSNHAREVLNPLNYPGCKQRRPGAQAAEPRRAGAEQAAELISLSHAAAMSRSPGSNHGFYRKTRKSFTAIFSRVDAAGSWTGEEGASPSQAPRAGRPSSSA